MGIAKRAKPENILNAVGLAAAVIVIGLSCYRIFLSIDLTDEIQHVGQILMLMRGGSPFYTDLFVQQTAAFPFVPLFHLTDWLFDDPPWILVNRVALLLLSVLSAICFCQMARILGLPYVESCLVSSLLVVFVPFSIPSLSYNNVSFYGFVIATSLSVAEIHSLFSRFRNLLIGFVSALCVAAYPTILLAAGLMAVILLRESSEDQRLKRLAWLSIGFAVGALPFFLLILLSWQSFLESLIFSASFNVGGGLEKLYLIYSQLIGLFRAEAYTFTLGHVTMPLASRAEWWVFLAVSLVASACLRLCSTYDARVLVIGAWLVTCSLNFVGFYYHYNLIILSGVFFIATRLLTPMGAPRSAASLVWPMLLYAATATFTSSNGLPNAILGLYAVMLYFLIRIGMSVSHGSLKPRLIVSAVLIVVSMQFVSLRFQAVYRDQPVSSLTAQLGSGAFRFLYTSEQRSQEIEILQSVINEQGTSEDRVLFLEGLAHGYIMTAMKPASRMLYLHGFPYEGVREELIPEYYYEGRVTPDLVFMRGGTNYPLKNWFATNPNYNLVKSFPLSPSSFGEVYKLSVAP